MLRSLHITNYALIEDLTIEFGPGLNVLTGETGAGKSIILDAVACILGARASSESIRSGCSTATIEALFDVSDNPEARHLMEEMGFNGPELLVSRDISLTERNACRINGRLATVSMLQELGQFLVELHGQHEHRQILTDSTHLTLLDEFGVDQKLRSEVSSQFEELKSKISRLEALRAQERDRVQRIDVLRFQLEEIDAANLLDGEEDLLKQERRVLGSAEKLRAAVSSAYELVYEGEDVSGYLLLGQALASLEEAARIDVRLQGILDLLRSSTYQVEEAARDLREYRDDLDVNPERLLQVENRLDLINQLKRKYGDSITEILAFRKEAAAELEDLSSSERTADGLVRAIAELKKSLGRTAKELSEARRSAAKRLETLMEEELCGLNMPQCRFAVDFLPVRSQITADVNGQEVPVNQHGFEAVRFMIAPNPGEELKPLSKIASGGETSRIVLALKSILAKESSGTLVFDEIDTGIGGRTAEAVASRLRRLADKQQVLCVTHLPVVAAKANIHYYIEKQVSGTRTRASVTRLTHDGRLMEIVRMMGGKDTEATRQHAAMLISEAAQ